VTASFFVAASPEQAYQILIDHPRLPQFMPNLDACIVRKQGPGWAEVEMRNARGSMVLRRVFDPPRRIQWSLVEGTLLKRVDGSWRLDGVDGGTILTYDSEVETTVPVPAFIIQFVQQDSLGALVSNVRQRIDSHGTWIKPSSK
jgi:ribosome-associated toxin RatA of RatAB toxin-antitoxin module